MTTRESTQEEIEARRAEIKAAHCPGDGVSTRDLRETHDWRLSKREPTYTLDGSSFGICPQGGWAEQWYCTRCRKFEERTVMLDGS